jgi:hypothetical protein
MAHHTHARGSHLPGVSPTTTHSGLRHCCQAAAAAVVAATLLLLVLVPWLLLLLAVHHSGWLQRAWAVAWSGSLRARPQCLPAVCWHLCLDVALLLTLFVALLLRACACGSSTRLVLLQVACRLSHARVSSCCWPPWGCTKGGGWAGGAGCCPSWPSVESALGCVSAAP